VESLFRSFRSERGEAPTWLTIVTAALAALATVFAATSGLVLQGKVAELETAVSRDQLVLERQVFEADQKARRDVLLGTYVPMLMSTEPGEVQSARAVLFVIFPNEANQILDNALKGATQQQQDALQDVLAEAEVIAAETGTWAIIVATLPDLDSARSLKAVVETDFGPIGLFEKDKMWTVVRTDLPDKETAEGVLISIRSAVREDALVVNFNEWCPNRIDAGIEGAEVNVLCDPDGS